mmetsp:Transcript_93889/g.269116  ORF Transcript_93889/g.269116 Transcript_93889/m.269116 type:complete len:236 (-) Transcript_93889:390-1097(-)
MVLLVYALEQILGHLQAGLATLRILAGEPHEHRLLQLPPLALDEPRAAAPELDHAVGLPPEVLHIGLAGTQDLHRCGELGVQVLCLDDDLAAPHGPRCAAGRRGPAHRRQRAQSPTGRKPGRQRGGALGHRAGGHRRARRWRHHRHRRGRRLRQLTRHGLPHRHRPRGSGQKRRQPEGPATELLGTAVHDSQRAGGTIEVAEVAVELPLRVGGIHSVVKGDDTDFSRSVAAHLHG